MKSIVPRESTAPVEMRLVPDQDPDAVEDAVRRHPRDFDLEIRRLAAIPPSMFRHATNERIRRDDLYRGVRSTAALC